MTVAEFLTTIKQASDYYPNSLTLKSFDNYGCVYKYLVNCKYYASRQEIFIELDSNESELDLLNRTVVSTVIIQEAR